MRRLYRWLTQLHPRRFREQFGGEMMAIFEQASGSHGALIADAFASLFRQWTSRPQPVEAPAAVSSLFMSLEPYRIRPAALVHGAYATLALFVAVIFLIDHPGKAQRWLVGMERAAESLLPISRSSLEGQDLNTTVQLPEPAKDPWMKLAIAYYKYLPVMKALDIDGDYTISGRELILAPASLRSLDRNQDGKLDPWECGAAAGSPHPAAFISRNPVLAVIDTDRNGELSAEEIANSSVSLQALDRNGDGRLTPDEYLPRP
jgi:hypothetical protein